MDAAKVLDEGPWVYDNFHIVVDRIAPGAVQRAVPLNHIDFWVQVHGLPFGFIQQRVGQGIGQFLGEMKWYDNRNTVHSFFMRLKVRIDITRPLKKQWQVRANNGAYVTIHFKYEKLGVFCYRCGLLGHTDKVCPDLFELDSDDGVREWGVELRPVVRRVGTAATNRWLQDPIPSVMPRTVNAFGGTHAGTSNTADDGNVNISSLGGRLNALHNEINSIKNGIMIVQNNSLAKSGKAITAMHLNSALPSSSASASATVLNISKPVVLSLPAAPTDGARTENVAAPNESEAEDIRSEIKKRKRMLAECLQSGAPQNDIEFSFADDGVNGDTELGDNVSEGGDIVMNVCDNPLFENIDVSAGSDDQACREI
jgi:hypothetical protein